MDCIVHAAWSGEVNVTWALLTYLEEESWEYCSCSSLSGISSRTFGLRLSGQESHIPTAETKW